MGRAYNPTRIIKSSGVHTFYIGQPEDPVPQAFEAYCLHNNQTFSESCRNMIAYFLVKQGLIEDPGVDRQIFFGVGGGKFTKKYAAYRKAANMIRKEQLKCLAKDTKPKKATRAKTKS